MKILHRLPITEERTSLRFGGRYITVRSSQVLVWMSVHMAGVLEPEPSIPMFPALLDTGSNFGFSIQDRHLREWAGLDPALLELLGHVKINGQVVTRRQAKVWVYPNIPGRQEVAYGMPPFWVKIPKGVAIYPSDSVTPGPRLPLLGLPSLLNNDLDWWLDPERRHITVQTRNWRRPLIRLLC